MSFDLELEELRRRITDLTRAVADEEQRDALTEMLTHAVAELWPEEGDDLPLDRDAKSDDRHVAIFSRTDVVVPAGDAQAAAGLAQLMGDTPLIDVERLLAAGVGITSDVYEFIEVGQPLSPDDMDPFAPTREL